MLELLSIVPVTLLAMVTGWFVWPIVVDPISNAFARSHSMDVDQSGEDLLDAWARQGNFAHMVDAS